MKQVRITVLRKQLYEDMAEMPEGFCPWAWVDVYPSVSALSGGATCTPWQNRDGVRPVTFLLEPGEE